MIIIISLMCWRVTPEALASEARVPAPDHVVVVVMENHSFSDIMENGSAPFLQELAQRGAAFERSYAVAHPSQPNYFALFSGTTQNVHDDGYHAFEEPTLAGQLKSVGRSFRGYAEYASPRKHNPWESFEESRNLGRNFSSFPRDFTTLPTVSFVIPNLSNDMHDAPIAEGDNWLRQNIGSYADWCLDHNSLLIVTFDEDDNTAENRIPTIFYGAHVRPGWYPDKINHYTVLRTIQAMYGLGPLALSSDEPPITEIWASD